MDAPNNGAAGSRSARLDFASAKRVLTAIELDSSPDTVPVEGLPDFPQIPGYLFDSVVGRGAGGTVYKVFRVGGNAATPLALKLLNLAHGGGSFSEPGSGSSRSRAWRELDALHDLHLPCTPRLLEWGDWHGRLFIVTDLIDGLPFDEHCEKHHLDQRSRVTLLAAAADAVQMLHESAVIHRDIKPSNILVDSHGRPIIIDLGLAKIAAVNTSSPTLTVDGSVMGTPAFMSPEQARGGRPRQSRVGSPHPKGGPEIAIDDDACGPEVSTRSDVYSLGATAWSVLLGQTPFDLQELSLTEALHRVAYGEPRNPLLIDGTLDRQLAAVLSKACSPHARDRYGSAAEFAADLRRFLQGESVQAVEPSFSHRVRHTLRRHRGLLIAAMSVFAVLLMGIIGTSWGLVRANERAESEAFEAYLGNLSAADAALSYNEPARVRARLDACPEPLRNWEWRWLNARSDNSLFAMRGEGEDNAGAERPFGPVTFSPSGDCTVGVCGENSVQVWDSVSGESRFILEDKNRKIERAGISPSGLRLLTFGSDYDVHVWSAVTGGAVSLLHGHEDQVNFAAFSLTGDRVVTASCDGTARVWDTETGVQLAVLQGHPGNVMSAAFNSQGTRVVTLGVEDNDARVWDAATTDYPCLAVLSGHLNWVAAAAFNPRGDRVVTASNDDTARVWDATTGAQLLLLAGHNDYVQTAVYSPSGNFILTASSDHTASVWDAGSGARLKVLRGHSREIISAVFSPQGDRIATSSADATARVWVAATGEEVAVLRGHRTGSDAAMFTPCGKFVVTNSRRPEARTWDAATNSAIVVRDAKGKGLQWTAVSPDGASFVTASADSIARVWDMGTGEELCMLVGHESTVLCAAFNRDGTRIATASRDNTARVWDAATGAQLAVLRGHTEEVRSVAFSPVDSARARVATASWDKTSRIWDVVTGEQLVKIHGHTDFVGSVAFSPDGARIVTGSSDSSARIWDSATGKELAVLLGHGNEVTYAGFSPSGDRVLTASADGTARVWNVLSGSTLVVMRGHEGTIRSAAFSQDGSRVATAGWDRTARLWDAATGKEVAALRGHKGDVMTVAFSPDGTRIVTASWDGTARVWDSVPYRERFKELRDRGLR